MTELYDPQLDVGIEFRDGATRAAVVRWIVDSGCDHAVTLATNARMPLKRALSRVREWLYRMEKATRGCRPERLPMEARLFAFIVPEHIDTNVHFHLAIRLVDGRDVTVDALDAVYELAEREWAMVLPSGDIKIKPVTDAAGWGRYMTKDHYLRGTTLVLSHDFHNSARFTEWQKLKSASAWA